MLSRGLPPAPQTGNSPVPRATPRIHHCPSWKPASQSRLTQGLLSLFQCNHIPRHCSPSCSCDLHFFFPSCVTLHEDVFQCRCSRRSIPARPASRQQRQPCSRFLHLLAHSFTYWLTFPPRLSSVTVQVLSSQATSATPLSSPSAGARQKEEATRDQDTGG